VTYTSIRWNYGVARISSILKITGLFCKRALQKRRYSAKDVFVTYNNVHWNPYLHHESHTRAYLCRNHIWELDERIAAKVALKLLQVIRLPLEIELPRHHTANMAKIK